LKTDRSLNIIEMRKAEREMNKDQVEMIIEQWNKERPDLDAAPMGIIGRIWRLNRILMSSVQEVCARFGLTHGEFDVLAVLRRSGPPYSLTPTELFRSLMLSSGAMTNRVDKLENAGFVRRSEDPNDRRGVIVSLTSKGKAVIGKAVESHVANEHRLVESLTAKEKADLARLLRKLLLSLMKRS
jgi:DNA-binding MarR family transcriptional regulator